MVSVLSVLELGSIDRMARHELAEAIETRRSDLPVDLLADLEGQPLCHLQMLLLAGRLIHVLRQLRQRGQLRDGV